MTLNEFSTLLIRLTSLTILAGLIITFQLQAQGIQSYQRFVPQNINVQTVAKDTSSTKMVYPDPKSVLRKSLIIPGWGQVVNRQAWKVPIVYGVLGGLSYYSIYLHKQYHDYRAAYYNLNPQTPEDLRFGATPSYISDNSSLTALRQNRNYFRNRRDLIYVVIGLSYALNAIDAYVFAHLRSFDVSDDLSMKATVHPGLLAVRNREPVPSISLSIKF